MMRLSTLLVLWAALPALAHDFHASLMVLEHNPATGEAEIALRLFTDDLETVVSKAGGEKLELESPQGEAAVFAYLGKSLKLKNASGSLKLNWVGMEVDVDSSWVYVSCPLKDGAKGLEIANRIFCDLFQDQINTVNVKWGKNVKTFTFGRDSGFQKVK